MKNATIEQLAYLINHAKKNNKPKPIVFLGAGASKTGGIPLAGEIVSDILEKYKDNPSVKLLSKKQHTYSQLMECLLPEERNSLLKEYIDKGKINVTHIYLAQLIKDGYVDYVLTVNFDNLMLRALALYNEFPPVYDMAVLKDLTTTAFKEKSVVYLHGQHHGLWLLNTEEEMGKVESTLLRIIDPIKNGRAWIFIGYSGEDPVFKHITNLGRFDNGLYWVAYNHDNPSNKICENLLDKPNTNAHIVKGYDADSFMLSLCVELGLPQPSIIDKPFTALQGTLDNIVDIDDTEHFKNVKERLEIAKTDVNIAIQQFEEGKLNDNESLQKEIDVNLLKKQIINIILSNKFDNINEIEAITEQANSVNNAEITALLSGLYNNWGNILYELGKLNKDEIQYNQSIQKYEKAISLNPDYSLIYNNWGNTLSDLGRLKNDEDLYNQSIKKYEKAINLNPQYGNAYYNWGCVLFILAELKNDEVLYYQSIEKFEKATNLDPNDSSAYNNWGAILSNLGQLKNDQALYNKGIEKYKKAISLYPDYVDCHYNLANALSYLAELKKEEDLYIQSILQYEKTISLNPDDYNPYINLGNVLLALGRLKKDEGLFYKSIEKLKHSISLNPNNSVSYNNLGNALLALGRHKKDEGLLLQSIEQFKKAISLSPDDNIHYYNWASALLELAKLKNDNTIFEECRQKLLKAMELGSGGYNLACLHSIKGDREEALKLLDSSLSKSEVTIEHIDDDDDWDNLREDPDFIALLNKHRT